jgi:hypothetical protein
MRHLAFRTCFLQSVFPLSLFLILKRAQSGCNSELVFIFSGETGFAGLAKNPEFVAAIQKSFANQEKKTIYEGNIFMIR